MKLNLDEERDYCNNSKEYKWKDLIYELFFEIKSEILGQKIEIEEDEYKDNLKKTSIPNLVKYIHDSIQILVNKKIDEAKTKQKNYDNKYYLELNKGNKNIIPILIDEKNQYENIIRKLEEKERYLNKIIFQNNLQKDAMENKIGELLDIEEDFEKMKTKLKYDEGRFLENDRKDNEIIILRRENSNLKKSIEKLEEKAFSFKKEIENNKNEINNLQNEIKKLKIKMEDLQKQNENLKANNINININNITGTNNKNEILSNNNISNMFFREEHFFKKNNYPNKIFAYQKIKNKFLNIKKNNIDILNNTRTESLEKVKSDMINKYFIASKIYRNNSLINNSFKTSHCIFGQNYPGNNINQNNSQIQNFKNKVNNNIIRKVISPARDNNFRSNSSKAKENNKFKFINGESNHN